MSNTQIPILRTRLAACVEKVRDQLKKLLVELDAEAAEKAPMSKYVNDQYEASKKEIEQNLHRQELFLGYLQDLEGQVAFHFIKVDLDDFNRLGLWEPSIED